MLLFKNVAFTILVPGTFAVFIPYRMLISSHQLELSRIGILRDLGLVPVFFGGAIYLSCIWRFAHLGRGTPAPIDPPKTLVVSGAYRLTRNPMYVAVLSVIFGEAVLFASGSLFAYGLLILGMFYLFVVTYEEPTLRRQFGSSFDTYCGKVPRWLFTTILLLLLAAIPSASVGQQTADRHVIILSPDEGDRRVALTRDAIAFWNQTLLTLKLRPRLVEAGVIVASPMTRALETYARQISMRAEGLAPPDAGPTAPRDLINLHGDIVVLLSKQNIFSVTRAFDQRFFIVIQTDRVAPLNSSNVVRNVIAHELGHALGLVHNGDQTTLMCGPCNSLVFGPEARAFLPLTSDDRARLLELYPPR